MPKRGNPVVGGEVVVIGTAGHVDHGKSALVRALTGTDPDRLAEEKERGLTIVPGFAWMALPSGNLASFVDVPGHEDFLRNMLAGAGGIDAAMLVIAADEGPMPQTREHLAILDILDIDHGVTVLTKVDLVSDDDWLALVHDEAEGLLADTSLAGTPIIPVSAVTGTGLTTLVESIDRTVSNTPPAPDRGRPRLSVDRAFSLSGFGTVVTGTLRDGTLQPGDVLEILPSQLRARARSLQSHGKQVAQARPGTRVAINLAGIDAAAIDRGDVVTAPGCYRSTRLVDVMLRVLPGAPGPLRHDAPVHVYHDAAESPARARIVGAREIAPGETRPAQLHLPHPVVVAAGDRFVLRRPSPPATLGGGVILDTHPGKRRRRFRQTVLDHFAALAGGQSDEVAWHMLSEREPVRVEDLRPAETGLEPDERDTALHTLADAGRAHRLGALWITDRGLLVLHRRTKALLRDYHRRLPLRQGPPTEELRQQLGLTGEAFAAFLDHALAEGSLARTGELVHLPGHEVRFSPEEQTAIDALLSRYVANPFSPPSAKEAENAVGPAVVSAVVERGDLVAVGGDVLYDRQAYETLCSAVEKHLEEHGQVTVADLRDRFDTSRKYALALLEHLDRIRITRRVGDVHVRASSAGAQPGEARPSARQTE